MSTAVRELPKHPMVNIQGDSLLMEIIPEHELPVDCSPALAAERCSGVAIVYVTSSSGYNRRPHCSLHALGVCVDWMVGA